MTALAILGSIVGVGLLMVFSAIFNGYALSVLWGWFIVPTFGLPALAVAPAIGVALVVSYLTHQELKPNKKDEGFGDVLVRGTVYAILKPASPS